MKYHKHAFQQIATYSDNDYQVALQQKQNFPIQLTSQMYVWVLNFLNVLINIPQCKMDLKYLALFFCNCVATNIVRSNLSIIRFVVVRNMIWSQFSVNEKYDLLALAFSSWNKGQNLSNAVSNVVWILKHEALILGNIWFWWFPLWNMCLWWACGFVILRLVRHVAKYKQIAGCSFPSPHTTTCDSYNLFARGGWVTIPEDGKSSVV